jgi:hypothetical protein
MEHIIICRNGRQEIAGTSPAMTLDFIGNGSTRGKRRAV